MFLTPTLAFLKGIDFKTWVIIGLTAGMIGLWVTMQFKTITIGTLKNQLNEKNLVIQKYETDILNLTDSVKRQNAAIEGLVARNQEFEDTLGLAGEQNARLSAQAERMISMIKKSHVPPDCKGATDHLNEFTKEFAKEWNK
jgi:hypothetical protein